MLRASSRLFGTDGTRGIANADLTPELALALGRAFGVWLSEEGQAPRVLVARDTRLSGTMLASAVAAGLCSAGVNVYESGVLPTPGLCLLVPESSAGGGVIISASHNPPEFNGIKLVDSLGRKLSEDVERVLERRVSAEEDLGPRPTGEQVGLVLPGMDAPERYLNLLLHRWQGGSVLRGLRVVLDCAYGAAYEVAPAAFRRLGAEITALHDDLRGALINVGCGSLHPERLAEEVVRLEADLGVAFDGDADRAVLVDAKGQVRDGDFIKYVLAVDLQETGLLDPPLVVGTVMSNLGLELALRERGISLLRADVGDRWVVELMEREGARLGGEQSGHVICAELGVGDGLYAALRVCEAMARSGRSLAELCSPVRKVPQLLVNVPVRDRRSWERSRELQERIASWETRLAGRGRVLVRASGTEPLVRVMVEALEQSAALEAAEDLAGLIEQQFGFAGEDAAED